VRGPAGGLSRGAARGARPAPAGAIAAAALAAAAVLAAGGLAAAGARLVVEPREAPPDAPVWICAEGAPAPDSLRLERLDGPAGAPGMPALDLAWADGPQPLRLPAVLPARVVPGQLPFWDQDGGLPPGTYRIVAAGFAPETLRVREPSPAERRQRGVLARVRLRAAQGDSALAARLAQRLLELEPGGPYADAAFLALGALWRHSRFRERPESWLSEWIARHHARCAAGDGFRVWLASVPAPLGPEALRRAAARYPDTRAAAAATASLAARERAARR
jgi:hypothetical protein